MLQLTDRHINKINTCGYTVIDDIVPIRQIAEAKRTLTKIYAGEKNLSPLLNSKLYQRSVCLVHKEKVFRSICQTPEVLSLVSSLFGNDFTIGSLNALTIKPGEEQQNLHFDQRGVAGALSMLIVMFPLDDSTFENGCTRLIPASHQMVHRLDAKADSTVNQFTHLEEQAIHVEVAAGSAIAFNALLLHAVSRNTSNHFQDAVIATYCRKWVKPLWNIVASIPGNISINFTEEERQLFGFYQSNPTPYDYKRCNIYTPSRLRANLERVRRKIYKMTNSLIPKG